MLQCAAWDGGLAGQALCEAIGAPHVHTPHSLGLWKERQMLADFPDERARFEREFNFEKRNHYEVGGERLDRAEERMLCSRYEPFGMTAVEAMASGSPTVVTTHGGLFRVLRFGMDGLFADSFDPADLGITLLKPLRHPKLAERLSRNGAQVARKLFTWTGVAQQLISAVEDRSGRLSLSELEPTDDWFGPDDYN